MYIPKHWAKDTPLKNMYKFVNGLCFDYSAWYECIFLSLFNSSQLKTENNLSEHKQDVWVTYRIRDKRTRDMVSK